MSSDVKPAKVDRWQGLLKLRQRPAVAWILRLAQVLLGCAMLWWLFRSGIVDWGELLVRLQQADITRLSLASLCFLLTIIVIGMRYRLLLSEAVNLRYFFSLSLLQQALVNFIPWRLGEVSYPLLLRRDYQIPLHQGVAMLITVRLADLSVMLFFGIIAALRLGVDLRWLGLGAGATLAGATLCLVLLRHLVPERVAQIVALGRQALAPLQSGANLLRFALLTLGYFGLSVLQSTLILESFGLSVGLIDIVGLQALSLMFSLLPIHPPGGWGTTDLIQVLILEQLGYSPALTAPAILAAHSIYTLLFLIGGIAGWVLYRDVQASIQAGRVSSTS